MKRNIALWVMVLSFLVGTVLVIYPVACNLFYEKNQSYVLAQYDAAIAQNDQMEMSAELQAAQEYNRSLLEGEAILADPFNSDMESGQAGDRYFELLNPEQNGIMGYVEIPKISITLPIYHGTSAQVLERGVGHIPGTSLPVGGESTHTALTAHTGMAGKRMFTDLSQVEKGDVFYIHVLGTILAYQVEEIWVVEPDDTENLLIQPGRDLATLMTCYPYGINTQRLLVQGSRIPYSQALVQQGEQNTEPQKNVWKLEYEKAVLLCLAIYLPLTAVVVLVLIRRGKRRPFRYQRNSGPQEIEKEDQST